MNHDGASLHIAGLTFSRAARTILDNIDLTIPAGEHVAIVGPSGAGKSTLLQLIAGILRPDSGAVRIDGRAVVGPAPFTTLMFQRPALLPWATVIENVLLPLHFSGAARRDACIARERVLHLLDKVGIADRADARPAELSGGQQQRAALARALASAPRMLLLDEPFSALDPETRDGLRRDVRRLATERGLTLITVTHDLADATALAGRAIVLGGAPARILDDVQLGEGGEVVLRGRLAGARRAA
jgi:NitT/TauT family transport system ATP-binding protein